MAVGDELYKDIYGVEGEGVEGTGRVDTQEEPRREGSGFMECVR